MGHFCQYHITGTWHKTQEKFLNLVTGNEGKGRTLLRDQGEPFS